MAGNSEIIELAGLGRPFQLGMLYDCRRDMLIPGITLWDSKVLQENINKRPQANTGFTIIASDSSEDKSEALNVTASLEASFLSGLVSVKGSAEYLSDKKKSKQQSRVTLQYKATTRFEQLTMDHLGIGNIKHSNVFHEGSATHVVTGLLYGAQAFFVFDKEVQSHENHQEIQGALHACIKKIPLISIEGQASLKMTEAEKQEINKFSCTFHGDFALENNPVSYLDAIKVYSELPKLLGKNGENAVPVTAWLYPLTKLDSSAAKLVREISVGLVRRAHHIIDDLDHTAIQCQDLMKVDMAIQFPEIKTKLRKFKDLCSEYKLVFQKQLCNVLPLIRGGGKEEQELVTVLTSVERSPFQGGLMSACLNDQEKEMNVLRSYLDIMKEFPVFSSSNDMIKKTFNSANDYVVVFAFSSIAQENSYLDNLQTYLKELSINNCKEELIYEPSSSQEEPWFNGKGATRTRENAQLFKEFAMANSDRRNTAFCIASAPNKDIIGSSIHVYEKGKLLSSKFELPSKPPVPLFLHAEHDCIHLEIKEPAHGNNSVEHYIISYQAEGSSEWTSKNTEGKSLRVAIKDLEPQKEYRFTCKAVCCPGVSIASDETPLFKTLPCSPPGPPKEKYTESGSITITWDIPTSAGHTTEVTEYVIEYRECTEDKKMNKPWIPVKSTRRECTIKELRSETAYTFRVSASCARAGMSLPSAESVLKPSDKPSKPRAPEMKSEFFLEQSYTIQKANPSVYGLNLQKRYNETEGLNLFVFGQKVEAAKNKVILLLGATGSGKTTLINAMTNYILGVKWEERYRFKLIHEVTHKSQAESQTSKVTSYELYNQPGFQVPYSLTIVDTPGFGDTRGIEQDKKITKQIKNFLCNSLGIKHIDAVCFVIQASLARLSPTQKYIFDSILSIFGKDMADNIMIMVTFADGSNIPALEAIKAADMPCQKNKKGQPTHFSFNNSAVYAQKTVPCDSGSDSDENDDDNDKRNEIVWNSNIKKMKAFFKALENIEGKDLTLTIQVLEERERLSQAMELLTSQIQAGLSKMAEIESIKQLLKNEKEKMEENEKFVQEVDVVKTSRVFVNYNTMNCNTCFFTCHSSCFLPGEDDKKACAVFNHEGRCVMCPGGCADSSHEQEKFVWKYETVKEKKTVDQLMENFNKARKTFMNKHEMQEELDKELNVIRCKLSDLVHDSLKCLQRLDQIALKPTSLSAPEYFEVLIKMEEEERKPGFEGRVARLQQMKQECENLEKLTQGKYPLRSENQAVFV